MMQPVRELHDFRRRCMLRVWCPREETEAEEDAGDLGMSTVSLEKGQ